MHMTVDNVNFIFYVCIIVFVRRKRCPCLPVKWYEMRYFSHAAANSQVLEKMERCEQQPYRVLKPGFTCRFTLTNAHSACDTMRNKLLQSHNTQLQLEVQRVLEARYVMRITDQSWVNYHDRNVLYLQYHKVLFAFSIMTQRSWTCIRTCSFVQWRGVHACGRHPKTGKARSDQSKDSLFFFFYLKNESLECVDVPMTEELLGYWASFVPIINRRTP